MSPSKLAELLRRIESVEAECARAIEGARDAAALTEADNRFLAKKGALSEALRALRDLEPADRAAAGARANEAKARLEGAMRAKREAFGAAELQAKLEAERLDFTLPARRVPLGSLHPVTKIIVEITSIFRRLGFELSEGPEAETEFHNFDALNMPVDHPARDMQDTFYLPESVKPGVVLRTHTSPVQVRVMKGRRPPVRILSPGAVFRSDADMTHSPMFHQVEGLYVDRDVSFAELKGSLLFFAREMFGARTHIRLRPSYFPFVEPGAEVDVTCVMCGGKGCRVCKESGWLEIMGAGMVHPGVFESVGYAANGAFSGFAFGMGVERIAMLKFGIPDLRLLFENDIRFLRQFGI